MKKIIILCLLYTCSFIAYADMCPKANDVVVYRNGHYDVVAPSGWWIYENDYPQSPVVFRVAAWGDHHSEYSSVRCYYYIESSSSHVQFRSNRDYTDSSFSNHPKWSQDESTYHLCTSFIKDPKECSFN